MQLQCNKCKRFHRANDIKFPHVLLEEVKVKTEEGKEEKKYKVAGYVCFMCIRSENYVRLKEEARKEFKLLPTDVITKGHVNAFFKKIQMKKDSEIIIKKEEIKDEEVRINKDS